MSKFKAGDKVLVEATVNSIGSDNNLTSVLVANGVGIFADEKYIHPADEKNYFDGLMDAWRLARKIADMDCEKAYKMFGFYEMIDILGAYTPEEVRDILNKQEKEKEKEKEIHVGDVVKLWKGKTAVVTKAEEGVGCNLLFDDGDTGIAEWRAPTKTGRTIDIKGLLEQIGG